MSSPFDKKINERLESVRKSLNVQVGVDKQYNLIIKTLHDITPKLNNVLNYMKSVGVDPDTSEDLFDFFRDVCRPVMWEVKGYRKTDTSAVEWAFIFCNDNALEYIVWKLYEDLPQRSQVLARPYLPEHLRAAVTITQ